MRYIFPATMVVVITPPMRMNADNASCHAGTPKGKRAIIITGAVNGIMESHTARLLSGLLITEGIKEMETIIGNEIGNMN